MAYTDYILLTGTKNNAGDFLIKDSALRLLSEIRPDRTVECWDGWKPLDDNQLEKLSHAKALLLTGGPALRKDMYPGVYKLTNDLDKIRCPIATFGIGWKGKNGGLHTIGKYNFTEDSLSLLNLTKDAGFASSVRDEASYLTLRNLGFKNFNMTGCPALQHLRKFSELPQKIKTIAISPGVEFIRNSYFDKLTKELLLQIRSHFNGAHICVVFHHSLNSNSFANAYGKTSRLFNAQKKFADWCTKENFEVLDISGESGKLVEVYEKSDLHLGFRVHAHLYMCSRGKPSLLIAEDGRGSALKNTIGGMVHDDVIFQKSKPLEITKNGCGPEAIGRLLVLKLQEEIEGGFRHTESVKHNVLILRQRMLNFLKQLP